MAFGRLITVGGVSEEVRDTADDGESDFRLRMDLCERVEGELDNGDEAIEMVPEVVATSTPVQPERLRVVSSLSEKPESYQRHANIK